MLTLKTLIDQSFYNGKKLYVCFVDFKKAYDTVWRNGLYLKLLKCGVSAKFINLIRDMYARLQVSINILNNGLSLPFNSSVGLKQGVTSTGPACLHGLFNIWLVHYCLLLIHFLFILGRIC